MKTAEEIKDTLREFVCTQFFHKPEDLPNDLALIPNGYVDSTGFLEIVAYIEDTYGITVADPELTEENFGSIDRMAAFVIGKLTP